MKHFFTFLLTFAFSICLGQDQLYHVRLMRAAPGELLSVIELVREDIENHKSYGISRPTLMRHSQGDQWDLLLIYPINDMGEYFSSSSMEQRSGSNSLDKKYGDEFNRKIAWQESAVVKGPEIVLFQNQMNAYNFFHIEIFTSLPGKQAELLLERNMENVYLKEINRRPNFIFTRVFGAGWDIFTIGCYADIKDYASGADIPFETEDAAAKKAGFQGVNYIGSYLRELIAEHHDTLAGKVN